MCYWLKGQYIINWWVKEGVSKGLESCLLWQKHTANVQQGVHSLNLVPDSSKLKFKVMTTDSKTVLLPQPKLPWRQLFQLWQIMNCSSSLVEIIIQALKLIHSLSKVSVSALLLPEVDNNPPCKDPRHLLEEFLPILEFSPWPNPPCTLPAAGGKAP